MVTSNCGNITSSIATLSINPSTIITTQPTNQSVCPGNNAVFSVTASGNSLTYQWRKSGVNITGATSSSYSITGVIAGDAGNYDVVVAGTCGAVTSSVATLFVNAITAIITQPVSQTACTGANSTFSVTAGGTALIYQWRKGGVN